MTKGLNPNAPMKDSGVEWLGEVPEHWDTLPLKHICRIERGKFSHRPRNDPSFYGGEYPFIQTGDITSAAKTIKTWAQTLNDRGASVSRSFKKGTIVISIAANVGDVAILGIEAYFPDSIIGCQPEARVEQEFLYYLLRSAKSEISRSGSINTQANVNAEQLGGIIVCLPPLNEQQEIVDRLNEEESQRDKIATACATAIQLLNERRSALISAAVTGQIDVRGLVMEAIEQ